MRFHVCGWENNKVRDGRKQEEMCSVLAEGEAARLEKMKRTRVNRFVPRMGIRHGHGRGRLACAADGSEGVADARDGRFNGSAHPAGGVFPSGRGAGRRPFGSAHPAGRRAFGHVPVPRMGRSLWPRPAGGQTGKRCFAEADVL